jgi:Trypsin-like peptidase domain
MVTDGQDNLQDLQKCTVSIQRSSDSKVLGTGVIVTDHGLILTCYHVIGNLKNETIDFKDVDIYFPSAPEIKARANVLEEHSDASSDIAFLELQGKLPEHAAVANLSETIDSTHTFRSFGYRKEKAFDGLYTDGTIQGKVRKKFKTDDSNISLQEAIQLKSDGIDHGMSGAAVLDTQINRVIGIVSEHLATSSSVDENLALAIPIESIMKVCPELKQKNPGLRPIFDFVKKIGAEGIRKYEKIEELYVTPVNYDEIKKSLEEDRILFLTGTQEYGKTYTAVYLLWEYYKNKGYEPIWFKGSEEKEERRDVRKKFTNVEKYLKPHNIIYFEDPFGKREYEVNVDEGIVRNIASIIETVESTEDTYAIITSREEVFKEFEQKIIAEVDLKKYEKKLNVKTPYDYEKRKEMLFRWAAVMNCNWNEDQNLKNTVFETIKDERKLPTPLNVEQFAIATAKKELEKDELVERIEAKSKETAKSFAQEIKTMSLDKILFLSFPFISEYFSIDFVKENYEKLVKEIHDDEKLDFSTILEWFKNDKIDISYVESLKNKSIRFSHPSYYEAFEFATYENVSSSKLSKVLSNVLLNLAYKREASYFIAIAVAKNYDKLQDDNVKNLLFTLANSDDDAAYGVAAAIDSNFDKLPIGIRNQLLLKISNNKYLSQRVAEIVAKNYDKLQDDNVKNLLFTLANSDEDIARDVAYAVSYKFDKLPENVRRDLILKLISYNKALRSIAYDIYAFWDKIPSDILQLLSSELLKREPGTLINTIFFALREFRKDETKYNFARDLLFNLADNKEAAIHVASVLTTQIARYELSNDIRNQLLLKLVNDKDAAKSIAFDITHDSNHCFDNLPQNVKIELQKRLAKHGYNIG